MIAGKMMNVLSGKKYFSLQVIILMLTSSLNGQPTLIHLGLGERNRQDVSSPVSITWCSDLTDSQQYVKYGTSADHLQTLSVAGSNFHDHGLYTTSLRNLNNNVRYFYKCGSDKTGWSPVYSFQSEPKNGSFRVGIIGDTQNSAGNEGFSRTRIIAEHLKGYSPSFTLHVGDIVENGSFTEDWKGFLKATESLNTSSPLMPVLGNHDVQNQKGDDFQKPFQDFYSLFNLPGNEINYSFTYGKAIFIGIYSGCAQAANYDQVNYRPGSPEYTWLDDQLTSAENDKSINWIIVWMHFPVQSYGWSSVGRWKQNLLPLLERHRIDICLAGHRHVNERFYPYHNGFVVQGQNKYEFKAGTGIVFITNGSAGGDPTGLGGKDMNGIAYTADRPMYSFGIIDISADSLNYKVIDEDNNIVDRFTLRK